MKRRGARYLILASLTVQLIATVVIGRPLDPRTHRSEGVASLTSQRSHSTIKGLPASPFLFSDRVNMNSDLLSGQVSSSMLLTGRNWNVATLNPFVSKERFTSNWRAFVVGHLIKNAFHRDAPVQTSETK